MFLKKFLQKFGFMKGKTEEKPMKEIPVILNGRQVATVPNPNFRESVKVEGIGRNKELAEEIGNRMYGHNPLSWTIDGAKIEDKGEGRSLSFVMELGTMSVSCCEILKTMQQKVCYGHEYALMVRFNDKEKMEQVKSEVEVLPNIYVSIGKIEECCENMMSRLDNVLCRTDDCKKREDINSVIDFLGMTMLGNGELIRQIDFYNELDKDEYDRISEFFKKSKEEATKEE